MPGPSHQSEEVSVVGCAVLTVSDTRTPDSDVSGGIIKQRLEAAGHRVVEHGVVPDDPPRIRSRVVEMCSLSEVEALLLTGGTGLAPRDTTFEVLDRLYEKRLDGFGELFRARSFEQIGAAAMLSRASAGTVGTTIVFSMPGSPKAVELALDELIIPELGHIVHLLHTDPPEAGSVLI